MEAREKPGSGATLGIAERDNEMIIDVIWLGDANARREAREMPPVGRIVELTRNMTTAKIFAQIVSAAGGAPISQLRFHGVDPHLIFNRSTSALMSPNNGGNATPEEDAVMSLNPHLAPGRAQVSFYGSNRNRHVDQRIDRCRLNGNSERIRLKAWPNAASVNFL